LRVKYDEFADSLDWDAGPHGIDDACTFKPRCKGRFA
jgi:hypothetical protein